MAEKNTSEIAPEDTTIQKKAFANDGSSGSRAATPPPPPHSDNIMMMKNDNPSGTSPSPWRRSASSPTSAWPKAQRRRTQRMGNLSSAASNVSAPVTSVRQRRGGGETVPEEETQQQQQQQQQEEESAAESLQDRLTGLAIGGTLDFLKLAGGFTFQTAGTIAAPPISLARTHLLPVLWQALQDTASSKTPARLKDWLRILSSSVRQVFSVLAHTQQGHVFRERLLIWLGDVTDLLSCNATRQVICDGMACAVKWAELLDTAQCRAWTQQVTIWAVRLVQVASRDQNQLLLHNFHQLVQSGCQLLADPHTTLALAEVTAYLCHALEMQENHQQLHGAAYAATAASAEDEDHPDRNKPQQQQQQQQQRAARRKERDAYQTTTHTDRVTTMDTSSATVEQVILSSLGVDVATDAAANVDANASEDDGTLSGSVPSRVACEEDDLSEEEEVDWADQSSLRQQVEESLADEELSLSQQQPQEQQPPSSSSPSAAGGGEKTTTAAPPAPAGPAIWHDKARREINVQYLKEQIQARADAMAAAEQQEVATAAAQQQAESPDATDQDLEELVVGGGGGGGAAAEAAAAAVQSVKDHAAQLRQQIQLHAMELTGQQHQPDASNDPFQVPEGVSELPLEGESAVEHFHRILNTILDQKREDVLQSVNAQELRSSSSAQKGRVHLHPGAEAARTSPRESLTLKERLAQLSAAAAEQTAADDNARSLAYHYRKPSTQTKRIVLLVVAVAVLLGTVWFGLGCYGLYTLVIAPRLHPHITSSPKDSAISPVTAATSSFAQNTNNNEIVIRVVRQVVHVDASGNPVRAASNNDGTTMTSEMLQPEEVDKLAECVAGAIN